MLRAKIAGLSRDALIYGAGDGLGRLIGLIMLPILSRVFGPADYGTIDLLSITYAFSLVLLRVGVPSGVQRFYYRNEGEDRRRLVTSSVAFMLLLAVTVATGIAVFARPIGSLLDSGGVDLTLPIRILCLVLPIEMFWNYLVLLLRLQRKPLTFAMANIGIVIITPTLTYVFVVAQSMGMVGVFLAKLVALLVVTASIYFVARREFTREIRFSIFLDVVRFALPGHPALLVQQGMNVVPRYLLAAFAPMTEVGLFGIAQRLSSLMRISIDAFNRAWNPFAYSNEGAKEEQRIYEVVFRGLLVGLMTLGATLSLFAPEVVRLLTPEEYAIAALLVPGVVTYVALDGIVLVFSTLLYTRNRVRWSSYLGATKLLIFIGCGLVLVPEHQAVGLVISLVLAAAVHLALYVFVTLKVFAFDVPVWRTLGLTIAIAALVMAATSLALPVWPLVLVKLTAVVLVLVLSAFVLISTTEREQLRRLFASSAKPVRGSESS